MSVNDVEYKLQNSLSLTIIPFLISFVFLVGVTFPLVALDKIQKRGKKLCSLEFPPFPKVKSSPNLNLTSM